MPGVGDFDLHRLFQQVFNRHDAVVPGIARHDDEVVELRRGARHRHFGNEVDGDLKIRDEGAGVHDGGDGAPRVQAEAELPAHQVVDAVAGHGARHPAVAHDGDARHRVVLQKNVIDLLGRRVGGNGGAAAAQVADVDAGKIVKIQVVVLHVPLPDCLQHTAAGGLHPPVRHLQEKALPVMHPDVYQGLQLPLRFNSLGNQGGVGNPAEIVQALDQRLFVAVPVDSADQAHVQLDVLRVKVGDHGQTGVPRPRVVDGDFVVLVPVMADDVFEVLQIACGVFFRDFKRDLVGADLIFFQVFFCKAVPEFFVADHVGAYV